MRLSMLFLTAVLAARAGTISSQAVGHQYRQDDWPAIAAAPDGSLWVAWLSFNGARDDIAIRHYQDGKWSNLHWVPNTSGDNWLPQIAVDGANRPWVVWSQQLNGNWDLYARRFDPAQLRHRHDLYGPEFGAVEDDSGHQTLTVRWTPLSRQSFMGA